MQVMSASLCVCYAYGHVVAQLPFASSYQMNNDMGRKSSPLFQQPVSASICDSDAWCSLSVTWAYENHPATPHV